jgi:hypothetical protein
MTARNDWFRVDKEGLAQVYARRGPAAPFFELISNAWDEEGVTEVHLTVTAVPGLPKVEIVCVDNSTHGFRDLNDARTLFAPSYKKGTAEQRGRFNVGEKLFLALCEHAEITSTGGRIVFDESGRFIQGRLTRDSGTEVKARMRMTREQAELAYLGLDRMYVPKGITTKIEFIGFGDPLAHEFRQVIPCGLTFREQLQTELSNDEGVIRPTQRIGTVEVWDAAVGESGALTGWLFEMGIPVVEIGGPFDLNVMQKVPLNVERDNVTPAFLRRLRAHVLNNAYRRIETKEQAREPWVTEAMRSSSPTPEPEALTHVLDLRYGKKRVIFDPTDPEGTKIAVSEGYAVVHGGSLPREAWANVKTTGTMLPAGQVTPSKADKSAKSESVRPEDVEGGVEVIAAYKRLARDLIGETVQVIILKSAATVLADYGSRKIRLNLQQLGRAWFKRVLEEGRLSQEHVELLVHELGHEFASDHLDASYHRSQTRLGVKLAFLAVANGIGADLFQIPKPKVKPQ